MVGEWLLTSFHSSPLFQSTIYIYIMSQESKGKVSIANIFALLGIAGIGVVSAIGALLNSSDGVLTWPIIWGVIVMVVLGSLLGIALFAKQEDSHHSLWRTVMWLTILVYPVVALLICGPFLKFFYVASEKENLQAQANKEIKQVEMLFKSYEEQCDSFLNAAKGQLEAFETAAKYDPYYSGTQKLIEFHNDYVTAGAEKWYETVALPSTDISKLKQKDKWKELRQGVSKWNYFELPSLAIRLNDMQEKTWKELNKKIEKYGKNKQLIPVISGGQGQVYDLEGCAQFDLEAPKSKFADQLKQKKNVITVWGILAYVLLNFLVLFNILVAPSSRTVGPKRNVDTGGSTL